MLMYETSMYVKWMMYIIRIANHHFLFLESFVVVNVILIFRRPQHHIELVSEVHVCIVLSLHKTITPPGGKVVYYG